MNPTREYQRLRRKGWRSADAWQVATVKARWEDAGGYIKTDGYDEDTTEHPVRLRIEPDEIVSLDDLAGDTFDPKANPDIPKARMDREREAFIETVNRDGVWGVIAEYWNGEKWVHADSCWGFVGDDWQDSGYDVDAMEAALEALAKLEHCPTCGRPRP